MPSGNEIKCINDCTGHGRCDFGTCRCNPGWGVATGDRTQGDCSLFLMRIGLVGVNGTVVLVNGSNTDLTGQTNEQGGFGQIVLSLLTRPDDDVTCHVTSSNEKEGKVISTMISISPQDWDER